MGIPLTDEQLAKADARCPKHQCCWTPRSHRFQAENFFALKEDSPEASFASLLQLPQRLLVH